ncbi:MAG TPA: hypothetical protein VG693_04265, partial [Actinomycetes bacterium]|nr:hypothetical protein [Actinomycetes bacterium]
MAPVAAAVVPHPPLLVPELAGAAAPELDPLRAACQEALATVVAAADLLVAGRVPLQVLAGAFGPTPAEPGEPGDERTLHGRVEGGLRGRVLYED